MLPQFNHQMMPQNFNPFAQFNPQFQILSSQTPFQSPSPQTSNFPIADDEPETEPEEVPLQWKKGERERKRDTARVTQGEDGKPTMVS